MVANQPPTILIVDDLKENLFLLEAIIKRLGIKIVKARSGSEALKKIRGTDLALAIIDVRMPEMNGYELAMKMNESRGADKVPVIFLTANHYSEMELFEGYRSGAVDYIFKPVHNHILLGKINVFLELFSQKQNLKINEEKYRTIMNSSPDGILLTDMNGKIIEASDTALKLLGNISATAITGRPVMSLFPPDEDGTAKSIFDATLAEGKVENTEVKIMRSDNSLFAGEVGTNLIRGPEGDPVSILVTFRDISLRKNMETKQIHADRMANLGEMASGIAHEINQPLNIISMVMDKILFESAKKETVDVEFLKSKSDRIFENITRIRNIIDHIRTFSRSHRDYIPVAFSINESIRNAVSMVTEQFRFLGIRLDLELDEGIPDVLGNIYKFEQVIINLLVNAKDAVIERRNRQEGYSDMIIGIRTCQQDSSLVAEVTDNGIGISSSEISNIMLPFYTSKEEGKGTGLGLSICYQIVKEMQGTIDVYSQPMEGTMFRIVLRKEEKKQNGNRG